MKPKQQFQTVEELKESMPIIEPSKLSDDTWGVWVDEEALDTLKNSVHPFCEVQTKGGKSWYVKVSLAAVDKKYHTGAKYPSESVKDEDLEAWLEQHKGGQTQVSPSSISPPPDPWEDEVSEPEPEFVETPPDQDGGISR